MGQIIAISNTEYMESVWLNGEISRLGPLLTTKYGYVVEKAHDGAIYLNIDIDIVVALSYCYYCFVYFYPCQLRAEGYSICSIYVEYTRDIIFINKTNIFLSGIGIGIAVKYQMQNLYKFLAFRTHNIQIK